MGRAAAEPRQTVTGAVGFQKKTLLSERLPDRLEGANQLVLAEPVSPKK